MKREFVLNLMTLGHGDGRWGRRFAIFVGLAVLAFQGTAKDTNKARKITCF